MNTVIPVWTDNYDEFFPYRTSCPKCGKDIHLFKDFNESRPFYCTKCKFQFKASKPTPLTIIAARFGNAEE